MTAAVRRFLAPEVVQTSAMDCGPAALTAAATGFGLSVSYGRLREACQTSVDGTSIDQLEKVAGDLGLVVEQEMIPFDHFLSRAAPAVPAIVVVRQPDGATHFVVVWRRFGSVLQIMDPASGRRMIPVRRFSEDVFRHSMAVDAADWRRYAGGEEFLGPVREQLTTLGVGRAEAEALIARVLADPGWFPVAALDAAARLVTRLVGAGSVKAGREAILLLAGLLDETLTHVDDIHSAIPADNWSVAPNGIDPDTRRPSLTLSGIVLLRLKGRGASEQASDDGEVSAEIAAVRADKPAAPLKMIFGLMREDGLTAPVAVAGAVALGAAALLVETMLFRGLFDIGDSLQAGSQRLGGIVALGLFMLLALGLNFPALAQSMRLGRLFDLRLRMAILTKLPKLTDRYFQSRPISDMTDRAHAIHSIRALPGLGIHLLQLLADLCLTVVGITLIAPGSLLPALALAGAAILLPLIFQPIVNERDLRMRSHAGALNGFYLDSLLGLVPIRVHGAEKAVRHLHEGLLTEWARAGWRLARTQLMADGLQQVITAGLATGLLLWHFSSVGGVTGADLLLVYWVLKLPAAGHSLMALAQAYPAQRNSLLRLAEPLSAPESASVPFKEAQPAPAGAVGIELQEASVIAGGHRILEGLTLAIRPGEHVAIVGPSGAGKSSLIGLLLGWHQLASGTLRVDGAPLDSAALDRLRRQTAWVDPAVQIWNEALSDNLLYSAGEAGGARMSEALAASELRGVLQRLPQGLRTPLGEGGALLSGGEGQRVRLARAFAQSDVRLALLDEPFRGMDREQRHRLLGKARQHFSAATLICVTHDISETSGFDRVIVVESGGIVADGAPAALKQMPGRYRDLLAAEVALRERMWAGSHWRRIRLENGRVEG